MKKISFALLMLLTGCGTFVPHWEPYSQNEYNYEPVKSYELSHQYTVSTGSPMISAHKGIFQTYYKPIFTDIIIWGNRSITKFDNGSLETDQKWLSTYKYDSPDGDYILTSKAFYHGIIGIIVTDDGFVPDNPLLRLDKKGSLKRYSLNSDATKLFNKITELRKTKGNFKFELVYTGRVGSSINILYREYIGNFSRSSFYQNLSYDLSESKTIKFRTIGIDVSKATNSNITFSVTGDENLNWMP
jgi:hypothetical protein